MRRRSRRVLTCSYPGRCRMTGCRGRLWWCSIGHAVVMPAWVFGFLVLVVAGLALLAGHALEGPSLLDGLSRLGLGSKG